MPRSLRSQEGWLMIDNRCSGGGLQEMPTATCSHCHAQVLLNPLRTRERNFCRKCYAYVCDRAECIIECNGSLHRVFDDAEKAIRQGIPTPLKF